MTNASVDLERARQWADAAGLTFTWEPDFSVNHAHEFDCYDEEPDTCEGCVLRRGDEVLASLWCIDDADGEYRRQVEGELAAEVMPDDEPALVRADLLWVDADETTHSIAFNPATIGHGSTIDDVRAAWHHVVDELLDRVAAQTIA